MSLFAPRGGMVMSLRLFAVLLILTWPVPHAGGAGATFAVVGATVVDGAGAEPRVATVLVQDGRITAVAADVTLPPGTRTIDGTGKTLIPGLFDLHTHLPYSAVAGVSGDWAKNLKAYLYCGVTTVVDFGLYPEMFAPMRRLLGEGVVQGPRIHMAARISTPGGHGLEGGRGDYHTQAVIGPEAGRAAVKNVLPYEPDVIKVFTDGWRYGYAPEMTSMSEETLAAIVEEAHGSGLEVLTHTVTLRGAKIAARAGVDVIAHGVGDQESGAELIGLLRQRGITYAPTLAVYHPHGREILTPLLRTVIEPLALNKIAPPLTPPNRDGELVRPYQTGTGGEPSPRAARWEKLMRNTTILRDGGVAFGAGTDAGVSGAYHGWSTLRELRLLVLGGLSPLEAITAATGNAARALHVDDERGAIAVGKAADLVLIDGQPHRDIADIEKVERVFLGGRELNRTALAAAIESAGDGSVPAVPVGPKLDDMERADGRTSLGTLRVNSTESGLDHSRLAFSRIARFGGGHSLMLLARMSRQEEPLVRLELPLTPGEVQPADLRAYQGLRFEARGEGGYAVVLRALNGRDYGGWQAPFEAGGEWREIRVPFESLRYSNAANTVAWSGADITAVEFEIRREKGDEAWLELDNVGFFK